MKRQGTHIPRPIFLPHPADAPLSRHRSQSGRPHPAGGRHEPLLLVAVALILAAVGCQAPDIGAIIDAVTNAIPPAIEQPADTSPTNTPPPADVPDPDPAPTANVPELVASGSFVRPSIATGPSGMLAVAAEGPKMASVWLWTWTGKVWQGGKVITASAATAGRTYVADTVIDPDGWTFASFRYGPKEVGTWHGPGLVIRSPAGKITAHYPGITTGAARLALDPAVPGCVILISKNGEWGAISHDGTVTRRGTYKAAGSTGEKFDFTSTGSRWATAVNGYSKEDASVSIGTIAGGTRTFVAAYTAYPQMGADPVYPSVAIGPDGAVWFASAFSGRLRMNSAHGGKPRWPTTALADLGPAVTGDRCPPRLVTAGGRLLAVWEAPGDAIMLADVEAVLANKRKAAKVCSGSQPAVAVDRAGSLHMVYVSAGTLRHRTLELP